MIQDVLIDPLRYVLGAGMVGFAGLILGLLIGLWIADDRPE